MTENVLFHPGERPKVSLPKTLLTRMNESPEAPTFILAPSHCGQIELLRLLMEPFLPGTLVCWYEVAESGRCQSTQRQRKSAHGHSAGLNSEHSAAPGSGQEACECSSSASGEKRTHGGSQASGRECNTAAGGEQLAYNRNTATNGGQRTNSHSTVGGEQLAQVGSSTSGDSRNTAAGGEVQTYGQADLAIITQIPWLEDGPARLFSEEIDRLLASGTRVVVCCAPQNDRYDNLQSDRVLITAQELKESGLFTLDNHTLCLRQFVHEHLPLQIRLSALLAVVLGHTNTEDLAQLGYPVPSDIPQLLCTLNPLFSYNDATGTVSAAQVDLEQLCGELAGLLGEYLEQQGECGGIAAVVGRVTTLSMALLERGNLELAHQLLSFAEDLICRGIHCADPNVSVLGHPQGGLHYASTSEGLQGALQDALKGTMKYSLQDTQQYTQRDALPVLSAATHQPTSTPVSVFTVSEGPVAPPIRLKLFGEMELSLDGRPLANSNLSRTKVRRLICFLALNNKRIVSKEQITEYLWPYLDGERGQNNLSTTWCFLARALGWESARECPYIQRSGEIYQLNARLFTCDVHDFESLARSVLFGNADLEAHLQRLFVMEELYKDNLLADLPSDSFLRNRRDQLRALMVDSLLLVTRQLRNAGQLEKALFCARAAFELDESREDVYRDLMDTQLVAGQRTSAMQTYFSCKRYLSDELGILPSKSTTALYQNLLLDNCT